MVNVGAHNTADAQRHVRGFTMFVWYGSFAGGHNTVGQMSAPTILLGFCHARKVAGYCLAGVQGMVLGIVIDLSALPYFLRLFPGPY